MTTSVLVVRTARASSADCVQAAATHELNRHHSPQGGGLCLVLQVRGPEHAVRSSPTASQLLNVRLKRWHGGLGSAVPLCPEGSCPVTIRATQPDTPSQENVVTPVIGTLGVTSRSVMSF